MKGQFQVQGAPGHSNSGGRVGSGGREKRKGTEEGNPLLHPANKTPASPFDTAGWCSRLLFRWLNAVTVRCLYESVDPQELPPLQKADIKEMHRGPLDGSLLAEERHYSRPSIFRATLRQFWRPIVVAMLWTIVKEFFSFGNTLLLKEILKEGEEPAQSSWKQGKKAYSPPYSYFATANNATKCSASFVLAADRRPSKPPPHFPNAQTKWLQQQLHQPTGVLT